MRTRVIVGDERRHRLSEHGFTPALIAALDVPADDAVARALWASNGEVLATILHAPHVDTIVPPGIVTPVCQVTEAAMHYVTLVQPASDAPATLVEWAEEFAGPVDGGVFGFVTDALVRAREAVPEIADEALVAWADRIGYPVAGYLLTDLDRGASATAESLRGWRAGFLARHAAPLAIVR